MLFQVVLATVLVTVVTADYMACNGSPRYLGQSDISGTIYSPGFQQGKEYPANVRCIWAFAVRQDMNLYFEFDAFDLDAQTGCQGDKLQFEVTNGRQSQMFKTICGSELPRKIYIPVKMVTVLAFMSDHVGLNKGFKIRWYYSLKKFCPAGQIMCANRKCVPVSMACDGRDDCGDATDETVYCKKVDMKVPKNWTCGEPRFPANEGLISRIIGGEAVRQGSWPWQADLQLAPIEPNGHFCGGALIAPQYVISAAHCLMAGREKENIKIILGNHFAFKEDKYEQVRRVKEYVVYPKYDSATYTKNPNIQFSMKHDIVIFKLDAPVELNDYVQPICVQNYDPRETTPIGETCYATGWGETRGTGSAHLLKQIPLKIKEKCKENSDGEAFDNLTMICTMSDVQGSQPCAGDSGGPLSCKKDGKWYVRGVASHVTSSNFIKPTCGNLEDGTIYSSVPAKRTWMAVAMSLMDRI